jgi:hypothetical protein
VLISRLHLGEKLLVTLVTAGFSRSIAASGKN